MNPKLKKLVEVLLAVVLSFLAARYGIQPSTTINLPEGVVTLPEGSELKQIGPAKFKVEITKQ